MKTKSNHLISRPNINLLIVVSYFLIKLFGTFFAIYVFGKFTPLVDSQNYIHNFYINDNHLRTVFIQKITSLLVSATHSSFLPHLIFSLFSGLGLLIYSWKIKNPVVLLIALFPSALVWTSIVGKEAVYFGCISLILPIWIKIIGAEMKLSDWIILAICFLIGFGMRPHYTIPFLWLISSSLIINIRERRALLILTYALFLATTIYFLYHDLIFRGYGAIDPSARASRFSMLSIDLLNPMEKFPHYIGMGFLFGIIGPLPSELIKRPEFIPFFLEGITILISPLIVLYLKKDLFSDAKNKKYSENFLLGLLPAIILIMIIHAPFGILNPGSAIRWRTNFELIFYFAPLLIFLELNRNA